MREWKRMQRVVVKIGTSSLTHENGKLAFQKIDRLARELADLRNRGLDVVLVSSGAIAAGVSALHLAERPGHTAGKQAAAAVGQAALMQLYEKFFSDYGQSVAQILITRDVMESEERRQNAANTFEQLFEYGVIPIVNENDTISTEEIEFGDNDRLSAYVAKLIQADLLILLSDIDGLYTADPAEDPDARLIARVTALTEELFGMAAGTHSAVGRGGMYTKLLAAEIAMQSGVHMVIANASEQEVLDRILRGDEIGTWFG